MKTKYNKAVRNFDIVLFILAIVNIAWAIGKSYMLEWDIFKISGVTIDVYAALIASIVLLYFVIRDLIYYIKHKKIRHGIDERTVKIVNNSIRNAGLTCTVILYLMILYYHLFNPSDIALLSLNTLSMVFYPVIIVFFGSFWYYGKKKEL